MRAWLRRNWLFPAFTTILVLGTIGFLAEGKNAPFVGYWFARWPSGSELANAVYSALRLFVLDFSSPNDQPGLVLQIARFCAALFSGLAALALAVPRVAQWFRIQLQRQSGRRAVVLGYGAVGQAVARELHQKRRGRFAVTAIDGHITPAMEETARRDRIILVAGDPSSPAAFRQVGMKRSAKVFVALANDMEALDAAEAARGHLGLQGTPVSVLLSDPDLVSGFADSSPRGFLGGPGIRGYSLAQEAAQALIADARFDRVALEAGQRRVHLVVLGCGAQGEAVVTETLLTAWRSNLGPPHVTIFDLDIATVEARLRRRSPAFFVPPDAPDALPAPARPTFAFHRLDIATTDFATDEAVARLVDEGADVTCWVFAAGRDSLNLRGALSLHTAMLRRHVTAAPIHVRIWNGHAGDTPVLSAPEVGIARAFGSYEGAVATTPACDPDPDAVPEALHAEYVASGKEMSAGSPDFPFEDSAWRDLPETKRAANRRLHRHAAMKLEDLGAQWRRGAPVIPVVDDALRDRFIGLEGRFDYGAIPADGLPERWWKDRGDGFVPTTDEWARATRLKDVAIAEHNRWTVDRAVDGWRPTVRPDPALRDDERRLHPSMHGWDTLDPITRRWDAVLLRALVGGGGKGRGAVSAWPAVAMSLALSLGRSQDGAAPKPRLVGAQPALAEGLVTQIDLSILGSAEPRWAEALADASVRAFEDLLDAKDSLSRLCRLRFVFHAPPSEGVLRVANAVASVASARGVEVSSSWLWKTADLPALGFVGHRDLARVGGDEGLADHLDRLFARLVGEGRVGSLVSGFAPGADRLAVERWLGLGLPRPKLVFPHGAADGQTFFTDDPRKAGLPETVARAEAKRSGAPIVATARAGVDAHVAQALDVIEACGLLVAVYDGKGPSGEGSVGDTIERARASGREVFVVSRGPDGRWLDM